MKKLVQKLFVILFAMSIAAGHAYAIAVDETPLADQQAEAKARQIMKGIRCLVCQNQSIEDSNADLARDLRQIVRERVAAGEGEAEVQAFLQARYGDWILLKPPLRRQTVLLWFGPFLFLLLGAIGLILVSRKRRQASAGPERLSQEEQKYLDEIIGEERE